MSRLHELLLTPLPGNRVVLLLRLAWGVVLGGAIGSYLGCVAWRLPRRLPLTPPSACPGCGTKVPLRRAVPVVSFLVLRGRAACCDTQLPRRYLLWETATLLVFAVVSTIAGLVALFGLVVATLAVPAAISALRAGRGHASDR